MLGDTALSFVPNPAKRGAGEPIDRSMVLDGHISDDPTGLMRALAKPINTVTSTGEALDGRQQQLAAAAKRVEDILDPETQKNFQSVLRDSAVALHAIREILGDEENREKLSQAMQRLPETLDNMNGTFHATERHAQEVHLADGYRA